MHVEALSKHEDNSQWEFKFTMSEVLVQPELRGHRPVCNLFADEHPTQVPGFFTRNRRLCAQLGAHNGKPPPLLYVNHPFHQIGRVLRKVLNEQPDCLLILPE